LILTVGQWMMKVGALFTIKDFYVKSQSTSYESFAGIFSLNLPVEKELDSSFQPQEGIMGKA
jgi:hypothetical protein